jgi:hypothetical protein
MLPALAIELTAAGTGSGYGVLVRWRHNGAELINHEDAIPC